MGYPVKYHEGNILIHDPSGMIHFVYEQKNEYYWTAETYQVPYTHEKDNNLKGYFGFMKGSNELFYFEESRHHKRINCNKLEEELDSINMGRKDGVKFKFSLRDSTFWFNFNDGTVYFHEKEVETQQLDMIQILKRDYRIWDAANKNKKMDLRFSRFIKCRGPCICKPYDPPHGEDDYTQQNIQLHENLRVTNMFVLQYREYSDLLEYEESKKKFPRLPKVPLIVRFDDPVNGHDMAYHALYQGHIQVIAKEIKGKNLATKDRLSEILYKFNSNKQFLTFFGIHKFKNRSFLVFESFSHHATDSTRETLFDGCSSQEEELLKNFKGLIEGVSYMHNEMEFPANVNMYGNVGTSNVVVVKNGGNGQNELKLFVEGFFVDDESDDFGDDESKTKKDDLRGLAQVSDTLIATFRCANEESKHLIQCLEMPCF